MENYGTLLTSAARGPADASQLSDGAGQQRKCLAYLRMIFRMSDEQETGDDDDQKDDHLQNGCLVQQSTETNQRLNRDRAQTREMGQELDVSPQKLQNNLSFCRIVHGGAVRVHGLRWVRFCGHGT